MGKTIDRGMSTLNATDETANPYGLILSKVERPQFPARAENGIGLKIQTEDTARFRHSYDFAMSSYILRNRLRIIGG